MQLGEEQRGRRTEWGGRGRSRGAGNNEEDRLSCRSRHRLSTRAAQKALAKSRAPLQVFLDLNFDLHPLTSLLPLFIVYILRQTGLQDCSSTQLLHRLPFSSSLRTPFRQAGKSARPSACAPSRPSPRADVCGTSWAEWISRETQPKRCAAINRSRHSQPSITIRHLPRMLGVLKAASRRKNKHKG